MGYYGAPQPGYPYPQPQGYYPPPQTSGKAVASLIFSILGLSVLPTLGSLIGLVLGYMARGEIRASAGRITGDGMATWGIILGWLGVTIACIGVCLAVLIVTGTVALPVSIGICSELQIPQY